MVRKKAKTIILTLTFFILLVLVYIYNLQLQNTTSNHNNSAYKSKIDHIVIIVDENKTLAALINNQNAPYINSLIKTGSVTTNYHAVSKNPYIALTTGSSTHIPNNCIPTIPKCQTLVANITDEIVKSGRTWKMYAESMPTTCDLKGTKKYTVRHNPFLYFPSISLNLNQCSSQIVPYTSLLTDIKNSTFPNYAFISPNLCNDMHNCSISTGDKWLSQNVPKILSSYAFTRQYSLLIITWDEGSKRDNRVLTIFLGPAANQGYVSQKAYNHYSILRTVEYVWDLKSLTKNDKKASTMTDMLKN